MEKNKISNECQFCKSRWCYQRIYREEPPIYDEVYCEKHTVEAENRADEILGGAGSKVYRTHQSSTGRLKRLLKA